MRWLYHVLPRGTDLGERYAPPSVVIEGFVHCSFRDEVRESALLYFPRDIGLEVLRIDPRRLDARVEVVGSPRGPMPHVHGPIPRDAVAAVLPLDRIDAEPDRVTGTHFGFVAFEGMTLLDLVGALDPISRIASMGFDPGARTSLLSLASERVWTCEGAALSVDQIRPPLGGMDVLIVPGGLGTRALCEDPSVIEYLATFPPNRLLASVCTGSLLLGAAGRLTGRRATTHWTVMTELARYGATPVDARLVDEGQLITAAGVSCALDLGMHLVRRFAGDEAARKIATQMQLPSTFVSGAP